MAAFLHERLNLKTVTWLFPVAFLIHDLEEILTAEGWMVSNSARLLHLVENDSFLRAMAESANLTTMQFAGAVGFELIIVCLASLFTNRMPGLFAGAIAVLFLNVFTHVGQTAMWGGYTPGVITALAVSLPYSLYAYRRLFAAGVLTWRSAIISALIGAVVAVPMVMTAHQAGRLLFP